MADRRHPLQRLLNAFGFRLSRYRPPPPDPLHALGIDLLLDVGASVGKYAQTVRERGYTGRLVSFEPLPAAHAVLARRASGDPLWQVHERCALGAAAGEAMVNIAGNSYSSSLLPMLPAHAEAAPQSVYVGQAATPVVALDDVFAQYRGDAKRIYLKIDTQGFEAEVLAGAARTLPEIFAVHMELSIVPLYEGQKLYPHFFDFFAAQGFELWGLEEEFVDPRTGRMLQFNATFTRPT